MTLAPPAHAETPSTRGDLEWQVPAGCPSRAAILERVGQLAGSGATTASRIEAHARVTKRDSSFVLVVTIRTDVAEETRTAQSQTCRAVGEAAAIILATALDEAREAHSHEAIANDEAATPNDAPSSPPLQREQGPAKAPTVVRSTLDAPVRSKRDLSIGVGLASLFDFGTLPRPTSGLEGAAYMRIDRWRFGFAAALWTAREQSFSERTRGGARFDVYTVGGFVCWTPLGARLRIGPCGELDLTRLEVEGFDIRRPATSGMSWTTFRLGGLAEARLTEALSVFLRADAVFAVGVPRIVLTTSASNMALHDIGDQALRLTIGARGDLL